MDGAVTGWQRQGFGSVTPYLLVEGAAELVEFLEDAFDAEILTRLDRPDGTLMHAELRIGDSMVMVGEATEEYGPYPASLYLYVEDCDDVFAAALEAGATIAMEPTTMRHAGERYGAVTDPAGNVWWIATHLEDVDVEEESRRIEEMTAAGEAPFDDYEAE
ncbi:MAG TPA: VOC family protein [Acidimicrobiia bacterium]|nr:VOC family protein [Acidimicrobiia bacterium]